MPKVSPKSKGSRPESWVQLALPLTFGDEPAEKNPPTLEGVPQHSDFKEKGGAKPR